MSYSYDPNQNPRSTPSGPAGGGTNYGQNYGQGGGQSFGQPFDEEETVGYPPQSGYPAQGYGQNYPAQGAYSRPVAGGQAGRLNNPANAYGQQYTSAADANAPVVVSPRTSGRNWLPYLVVGIVIVALVCCVLPGAILLRNNNIFGGNTTVQATPGIGATVYDRTLLVADDKWPMTNTCNFQPGGYTITNNVTCIATYSNVPNDLSIAVNVVQTAGPTGAPHGIALRRAGPNDYYVYGITSAGSWVFVKYADNKTPQTITQGFQKSAAIKTGLNATNKIEVRASGSTFYLFVNGTSVGQVTDNSYTSGLPGLTGNAGATVVYSNFTLSKLA